MPEGNVELSLVAVTLCVRIGRDCQLRGIVGYAIKQHVLTGDMDQLPGGPPSEQIATPGQSCAEGHVDAVEVEARFRTIGRGVE